jgi:purine-nucleoside phosphorylase
MTALYDRVQESAQALRAQGAGAPELAIVLGSGLGALAEGIEDRVVVPFEAVPHFGASTVDFHEGQLIFGSLEGLRVAVLEGRLHYYEGHSMETVVHPVRSLRALGAEGLVLTSAVGGMNAALARGDLVAVADHINLMGDNPLVGPNDERLGPRFPDMSQPYSRDYRAIAHGAAAAADIALKDGVLVAVAGPNLETAAEYRFLRGIGADVVGMSMVPENIAAVHMGMDVLGVAVVTDLCDPDALEPVDIPEILRVAAEAQPRLETLLLGFLAELHRRRGASHD